MSEQTSQNYRENAFHCLDWIPIFLEQSSKQIIVNIFLQIGLIFQQAAKLEDQPSIKMADEQLALKMYLTAVGIGHHLTPDIEIYVNTFVIKYISIFQFQDAMLNEVIPALKKRTLILSDVFPFFEGPQSNIALFKQENKIIHLMRKLLKSMVDIHEHNKIHLDKIEINHSAVTLLYQVYEACLKNWYQEEHDPVAERKFRLELMEELLFSNGWTFLDVEQHVDSPWIMVDRDEQGWMRPTRALPYSEEGGIVKYRSINGAELNQKTGEINFFMTPWTQDRPIYEKVFTLFDLQEMLEKNIDSAIFSLDPVDPDKPYHPFNALRFSPSQLCESELLNTMLLTDYILKFLTTNQEVQAQHPFEQRPVSSMIQHLPEYLRKIITDFHSAQHTGALHRFWIEAEEINIVLSDEEQKQDDTTRIGLGNLKMVVKKHRMERDIHGELKDVGNNDEGWPIYVLTLEQMAELELGIRKIEGHAMIFIHGKIRLFYWEHNNVLQFHVPKDHNETLIRLYKQPRDQDGKVIKNSENTRLLYRTTKEMASQSGLLHRYSPEFIFAHEFTTHYDEFAQYLPEFGRLKELSKISALIRFLNGMRRSNQESVQALDYLLSERPIQAASAAAVDQSDTESYRAYDHERQRISDNVVSIFKQYRSSCASSVVKKQWREKLAALKQEIGTLNFSSYSKEVTDACQRMHDEVSRDNPGVSSSRIWSEVIDPKRSEFARQMSESKQASCRSQIRDIFSPRLLAPLGASAYERLVDSFMQGNIDPLTSALAKHEQTEAQRQIHTQFSTSPLGDIALAIDDGGDAAATRIAKTEARDQLRQVKGFKDKVEAGFARIHLGANAEPVDLEGQCFWVPASVRHDVLKDEASGLTRYSFFVYGGVSVQPRINIVKGGNGSFGGNSIGGEAFKTKGLGSNPFRGKTFADIDQILTKRGFIKVGPNPASGQGSYFHTETGRKYYLDKGGSYKQGVELPHVDVHRMNNGVNLESVGKRRYPLGETLIKEKLNSRGMKC